MTVLSIRDLTIRIAGRPLLDGANLQIDDGRKVGLVGRNGAGKSTLLRAITGELQPDGGEIRLAARARMAHVAQEAPGGDEALLDVVLAADTERAALLAEADSHPDPARLAEIHERLIAIRADSAPARAGAILSGLGFDAAAQARPSREFSGGWRMRVALARALFLEPELLLLDEPTNHLDLDALVWLETWLKRYEGTMLVISHDREFLDAISTVTLHLDNEQLTRYGGNYSVFEETRAQQLELQQNAYAKQQDRIAHLQSFISRFKAKATKAKQAQSRVKALERIERLAPVLANAEFSFEFKEAANLPNPMLIMDNASFGYPAPAEAAAGTPATVIVRQVTRSVLAGQRIGILGANGQGKSTLVKTIARVLGCISGTISEGKGLHIGYFAQQELDVLRPDETPLEHMVRMAKEGLANGQSGREQDLRSFLGTFNFSGDMVKQAVGTMSGGEKARLVLCMIVWQRPNLLLLDEPTNHLDLATREALSLALNEFEGTVIVVSHDRSLLRSVCDEFWLVTRGGVQDFAGDLDDYQRYLLDEARRNRESLRESARNAKKPASRDAAPVSAGKKTSGNLKALARDQQRIEQSLLVLQAEQRSLEARLAISLSPQDLAVIGRRLKELADEMTTLENQWLTLSDQIDMATRPIPS